MDVSSTRRVDSSMETLKPAAAHVSVVDKGDLSNPFKQLLGTRPEERKKGPGITPTLSGAQFDALDRLQAHDRGIASIASVDFKGYVLENGKKHYVDRVHAKGLGNASGRYRPGEVILVANAKNGMRSSSPEEVAYYELLVTFPERIEEGDEDESTRHAENLYEYALDGIDPKRNPRAREEAKALFDAVAQYVDDGLDKSYAAQYIAELKDMLKRRIYHPVDGQKIQPIEKILRKAHAAANRKPEDGVRAQIADIRRIIQERDAKPRAPEESGNDVALAIVSNEIIVAERELRDRYGVDPDSATADGGAVPLSEEVLAIEADIRKRFGIDADAIGKPPEVAAKLEALRKLREEKRHIEDLVNGKQ